MGSDFDGLLLIMVLRGHAARSEEPGGFSPEEAVRRMVLPPGFHVEVFAAEPMVRQPLSANFDERGRLWVIEYLQYPNPAGLKPVTVDQYLRTEYDRCPIRRPRGPRGADRIKILEDTDGDGRADKRTVFVDGLNLASGLAVGHGGVFVGQAPISSSIPIETTTTGPTAILKCCLTGFGLQDAHATVNSMTWGPDGWLYGAQGSTVTAKIRGTEFQQGIWRYHPDLAPVRAVRGRRRQHLGPRLRPARATPLAAATGRTSRFTWFKAVTISRGLPSTDRCTIRTPTATSARSLIKDRRSAATSRPAASSTKAMHFPRNSAARSSAATCFRTRFTGMCSSMPDRRSRASTAARCSTPATAGSGRSTCLLGPDAAVYVVDWYDKRAAHLDPRDTWDRSNGRIYRIVYGERRKVPPFDLAKRSSAELVALRESTNDWFAAEAPAAPRGAPRRDDRCHAEISAARRSGRDDRPARPVGALCRAVGWTMAPPPSCSSNRWLKSGAGRSACWATTTG